MLRHLCQEARSICRTVWEPGTEKLKLYGQWWFQVVWIFSCQTTRQCTQDSCDIRFPEGVELLTVKAVHSAVKAPDGPRNPTHKIRLVFVPEGSSAALEQDPLPLEQGDSCADQLSPLLLWLSQHRPFFSVASSFIFSSLARTALVLLWQHQGKQLRRAAPC